MEHMYAMISLQPARQSTHEEGRKISQTNVDTSSIRFIDTFPYIAKPATGNGMIFSLGDELREIWEHHFRDNCWICI